MTDHQVLLDRANLLLEQSRFKDAETSIKQVLEQEPENDYALALLARCYLNNKRHEEGIEVIQQAIALDPQNSFYFYLLGFGYYQQNNYKAATDNLRKAISLYPYSAEYFGLLAYVLIEQKDFKQALEKANEGLALEAESSICLNARSTALNKLGKVEDAIETMQDALNADPDNEMTHATIGWNFLEKGKHKEATNHFLEALRINPNYTTAKRGLKEALKSKIPPYRWLLQYSFWIHNKGRKMQWVFPFALYILFRVAAAGASSNESTAGFSWVIIAIYILFVITSWTINSIANFFLLFNPIGKHALSVSERWSAISSVSALVSGLSLLAVASFTSIAANSPYEASLFIGGLICLSLALPLGLIDYPISIKGKNWKELYGIALAGLGLLTLVVFAIAPLAAVTLFVVYGIAFIVYNWAGLGR